MVTHCAVRTIEHHTRRPHAGTILSLEAVGQIYHPRAACQSVARTARVVRSYKQRTAHAVNAERWQTAASADPAPPSRSYYEAYTKKQKAGNRFQDAVFVERGALRVARDQNKPPLPHLPTERKAIDRATTRASSRRSSRPPARSWRASSSARSKFSSL